jgi:predicted DNA-binding transcriptional regulator YafY
MVSSSERPCAQLVRNIKLMRLLEGRRYRPSLLELASQFQVTTRTIRRDLKALEEAHVPVPPARPRGDDGCPGPDETYRCR